MLVAHFYTIKPISTRYSILHIDIINLKTFYIKCNIFNLVHYLSYT